MNLLLNQGSSGSEEELNDSKGDQQTITNPVTQNNSTISSTSSGANQAEGQNASAVPTDSSLPINLVLRMRLLFMQLDNFSLTM